MCDDGLENVSPFKCLAWHGLAIFGTHVKFQGCCMNSPISWKSFAHLESARTGTNKFFGDVELGSLEVRANPKIDDIYLYVYLYTKNDLLSPIHHIICLSYSIIGEYISVMRICIYEYVRVYVYVYVICICICCENHASSQRRIHRIDPLISP